MLTGAYAPASSSTSTKRIRSRPLTLSKFAISLSFWVVGWVVGFVMCACALMNIFPCLSLEVKEFSAKCVAFRDAPAHLIHGAFRDIALRPKLRNALHSTLHLGAVIAFNWPGGLGEPPMSRPCVTSRLASMTLCGGWFVDCHVDAGLDVHHGRDATEGQEGGGSRGGHVAEPERRRRRIPPNLAGEISLKSLTPPQPIFLQNRPGHPATFPHSVPTRLRRRWS